MSVCVFVPFEFLSHFYGLQKWKDDVNENKTKQHNQEKQQI